MSWTSYELSEFDNVMKQIAIADFFQCYKTSFSITVLLSSYFWQLNDTLTKNSDLNSGLITSFKIRLSSCFYVPRIHKSSKWEGAERLSCLLSLTVCHPPEKSWGKHQTSLKKYLGIIYLFSCFRYKKQDSTILPTAHRFRSLA